MVSVVSSLQKGCKFSNHGLSVWSLHVVCVGTIQYQTGGGGGIKTKTDLGQRS